MMPPRVLASGPKPCGGNNAERPNEVILRKPVRRAFDKF